MRPSPQRFARSQYTSEMRRLSVGIATSSMGAIGPGFAPTIRRGGFLSACLDLPPATGAVVGDHGFEEIQERLLADRLVLSHLNRTRCQIALPLIDDAFRVGRDGIVDEHVRDTTAEVRYSAPAELGRLPATNRDSACPRSVAQGTAVDPGEPELLALWEPLFSILTPAQRAEAEAIERIEREGMFAWGVRSGYFLWVQTHPGETPTMLQFALWKLTADLRAA